MFNSSLAPNVVKTAIDLVFNTAFSVQQVPGYVTESSAPFMQDTTDRAAVIVEQFQGPGYFQTKAEQQDIASGTARVGNSQTFTVTEWALSTDISKNLMDDDQHTTIEKLVGAMGRNGRLTKEKEAFKQYNLGFTTVLTNDSVALFSNSHVALDGTSIDNLETATLAESTFDNMIQSLLNQKTQDGTLGGHVPAMLLVPPALLKTANQILKSELRSGTGNNDMNYFSTVYPGLEVGFNPFLGATVGVSGSSLYHYLLSKEHSMTRWVRQPLVTDLVDYKTQRNNNYVYKASYREVVGPISFEGLVGSNGTV